MKYSGPSPDVNQGAKAQWSLVACLEQALGEGWRYSEASWTLRRIIHEARSRSSSPEGWAEAFVQDMLDALAALHTR